MVDLNISLPDSMKEFVDSKVGARRLKNASAYMQFLIAEAMEAEEDDFSEAQRERIDQMLLESTDSLDRGEAAMASKPPAYEIARAEFERAIDADKTNTRALIDLAEVGYSFARSPEAKRHPEADLRGCVTSNSRFPSSAFRKIGRGAQFPLLHCGRRGRCGIFARSRPIAGIPH